MECLSIFRPVPPAETKRICIEFLENKVKSRERYAHPWVSKSSSSVAKSNESGTDAEPSAL
jgi:hypothetical protein